MRDQRNYEFRDIVINIDNSICYKVTAVWESDGDTCISAFAKTIPQTEDYVCMLVSDLRNIIGDNQITIYPNPATNKLNITTKDGTTIEEVSIYNLTGQIVFQGKLQNNVLDISKLQSGMYVVEVVIGREKIKQKLIVR